MREDPPNVPDRRGGVNSPRAKEWVRRVNPELDRAYRSTSYQVMVPGEPPLELRIGVRSAGLDALLTRWGSERWAFITGWNPASRLRSPEENRARQAELVEAVIAGGWRHYPGAGVPDRAGWAPEDSLLVLDISRAEAVALGRRFGQRAILVGRNGEAPDLVYLAEQGE